MANDKFTIKLSLDMLYQCKVCGYVYDEKEGCPWFDKFEFRCPICGNEEFERLD